MIAEWFMGLCSLVFRTDFNRGLVVLVKARRNRLRGKTPDTREEAR